MKRNALIVLLAIMGAPLFAQPLVVQNEQRESGGAVESRAATSFNYDGNGLSIEGRLAEAAYKLNIQSFFQAQMMLEDFHGAGIGGDDDSARATLVRARTRFNGYVVDPLFRYNLELDWAEAEDGSLFYEGYVGYQATPTWGLFFGLTQLQYDSVSTSHETDRPFAVDSVATQNYNMDYAKGFWFTGSPMIGSTEWSYSGGIFNGDTRNGFDFRNADAGATSDDSELDLLYNFRLDFMPYGESEILMNQLADHRKGADRNTVIARFGAAFSYFRDSRDRSDLTFLATADEHPALVPYRIYNTTGELRSGDAEIYNLTLDMRVHYKGFALNAAFFHNSVNFSDTDANGDGLADGVDPNLPNGLTNIGWFVEASYTHHLRNGDMIEAAIRLGADDRDEFRTGAAALNDSTGPDRTEFGFALNYYLFGNAARANFTYLYNDLDFPRAATGFPGDYHRWILQFQVRF